MTPRVIVEPARLAGLSLLRCQTDERLVDLARAGNERAFEAIVDRYQRPLLRYCARLLPPNRAEDVVQQALLNAYAGMLRDDRRIELRPWLYRIAHNASLNALRENGWSHERIETVLAGGPDTTRETVERRASLETVLNAVQMLPERQRNAMILREIEGCSYEQIAIELDATGGAVRQLLHRARHTVRATATALTPAGLLTRLPLGGTVAERMSDAVVHETLRIGAGRVAGGVVAALAVAAGLSEAPKHLRLPPTAGPHRAPHVAHAPSQASPASSRAVATGRMVRIERPARAVQVEDRHVPLTDKVETIASVPGVAGAVERGVETGGFVPRAMLPPVPASSAAPATAVPPPPAADPPRAPVAEEATGDSPSPSRERWRSQEPGGEESPSGGSNDRPRRAREEDGDARQDERAGEGGGNAGGRGEDRGERGPAPGVGDVEVAGAGEGSDLGDGD